MDPRHDPKAAMAQGTEGQQRLCSGDTAKLSPWAARHLPERPSCLPGAVPHILCVGLGVNGEILLFLDLIPHLAGPGNSLSPVVTQPHAGCARALHQTAPKDGINAGSGLATVALRPQIHLWLIPRPLEQPRVVVWVPGTVWSGQKHSRVPGKSHRGAKPGTQGCHGSSQPSPKTGTCPSHQSPRTKESKVPKSGFVLSKTT